MTEEEAIFSSDNSNEGVALKLLFIILQKEEDSKKDRAFILSAYAECLRAVQSGVYPG